MDVFTDNLKAFLTRFPGNLLVKILLTFGLLWIGFWLIKRLLTFFSHSRLAREMDPGLLSFVRSFLSIALKTILLISAAGYLGVPTTSFITLLGTVSLAIGLGLQGSLSNIAGGLMILMFKQFKLGDFIETAQGESGKVTDISLVYTTLTTIDNKKIVIPNATLSNGVITNFTAAETRRIDLEFAVSYASDLAFVKQILLQCAAQDARILNTPQPPFTGLLRAQDSALIFVLRVWTKSEKYWDVYFALMEAVKTAFDTNGIEIPFPQLDVHTK